MRNFAKKYVLGFLVLCSFASAKDFGVHERTFAIMEEDPRAFLQKHSTENFFKEESEKAVKEYIENPPIVQGLSKAKEYRSFYFDPSFEAQEDYKDASGNVIIAKGTKTNPLELTAAQEPMLFFDGTDVEQIRWARNQDKEAIWMLVAGNPLALGEQEKRDVFFDQGGVYTGKFGIKNLPARVSVQGKKLLIEEVPVN